MISIKKFILPAILLIAASVTITATIMASQSLFQQQANAQGRPNLVQGLLTAASGSKPSGGERIGSYALEPLGGQGNWVLHVLVGVDKTPSAGKVFNTWLADTKTNSYLNIGQVSTDGKLSFLQNTASPYAHNQILVSEEPSNSSNIKPSKIIGGDALPAPFIG